jgi:predicted permease
VSPRLRNLALTVHVASSVGWFGAVAAFLALAVAGLGSPDPGRVHSSYAAMDLTACVVIVPLAFAALLTWLGVYKPRGQTGFGERGAPGAGNPTGGPPPWVKVSGLVFVAIVLLRIIVQLSGHDMHGH